MADEKAVLVEQIKDLQRNNPEAKQQWIAHTESNGGGMRDPNKHEAEFIQNFLVQYESGERLPVVQESPRGGKGGASFGFGGGGAKGGGYGGGNNMGIGYAPASYGGRNGGGQHLNQGYVVQHQPVSGFELDFTSFIKTLQKSSPNFKQAWANFCLTHGGINDPAKHDSTFMISFFDSICEQANSGGMPGGMMMGGGMMGGRSGVRSMPAHYAEPPVKRARTAPTAMAGALGMVGGMSGRMGGGGGGGGMGGGDPGKQAWVDLVKSYQRQGQAEKQTWWDHCDANLGGVRDPARHDVSVLSDFCSAYGLGGGGAGGGGYGGGGGGHGNGRAQARATEDAGDPEKQALVDRIKSFQRQGPENKEAWYAYCGDVKDPKRHDVAILQDFITTAGVP